MEIPEDLKPKEVQESVVVPVPLPVTHSSNNDSANDAARELNLYKIEKDRLVQIQQLGISCEGLGIATMAQGHLFGTGNAISMLIGRLAAKAQAIDLTTKELAAIGNNIGYLAGKMSTLMDTARKVADSNGMVLDGDGKKASKRKSFTPGAIVHAAPGSHVQIGMMTPRPDEGD